MTSYYKALLNIEGNSVYGPIVRKQIEELMATWANVQFIINGKHHYGLGIFIVDNIKKENYLNEKYMEEILLELYTYRNLLEKNASGIFEPNNIIQFENIYLEKCKNYRRKGSPIKLRRPLIIGTAIPRTKFKQLIKDQYFVKERFINELITELTTAPEIPKIDKKLYLMGYEKSTTWVTWNEHNSKIDPFEFATQPNKALKVKVNLGLSKKVHRGILLLFKFETNFAYNLLYPTIADAGLFEYFRASDEGHQHGWTKPWIIDFIPQTVDAREVKPRPEAVHEVGKFKFY